MVTIGLWHSNIPQENGTSSVVYWQFAAPVTIIGVTFVGFIVFYIVNRLKIKLVS
ncbi:hypothetical protein MKL26_01995 [Streptococcus suis]|nr:hypothetical protein [Streptococcus suis]